MKRRVVRGLAHITGEGLAGNVPRVLPPGRRVFLDAAAGTCRRSSPGCSGWATSMQAEMDRVFNMGIGFVMIVSHYYADSIIRQLGEEDCPARVIGEVRSGETGVEFSG